MRKRLLSAILIAVSPAATAAGWVNGKTIDEIGVKYGNGCVKLSNGQVLKIDVTSDVGKAEFSLALTARSLGKALDVYLTDDPLVGGCDTGTTIKPHRMLRMRD